MRRLLIRRVLRYAPNPVRDEWVNIGVLIFDPESGERRLRMVEEEDEFHRVRRLHPDADESVLPRLRDTWKACSPPKDGSGTGEAAVSNG